MILGTSYSPRILQVHCQSCTSQRTIQSFVKELAKPTQEKIVLKNFPTLQKKIKNATHSRHSMTQKLNIDNGLQGQTDRTPADNMRLASCGVQCLNSSSVFQIKFCAGLTVFAPKSTTLPSAKRWLQAYKPSRTDIKS